MIKLQTLLLNAKQLLKLSASAAVLASMVACGGNPYVENADRNDVVTLGDSIFDLSGDIQRNLEAYAGQTFRNYTQSGAELKGGSFATSVVNQYAAAKATDSNIQTLVMNGGGNDILIPAMTLDIYGCRTRWYRKNISSSCVNLINNVYVDAVNMLNGMDTDGVQNVIYLGYYELPRGNANLLKAVNYGDQRLGDACNNTTANCTFLDPRGMVPANHVLDDDIHPTAEGSLTLANLIWPHLQSVL